MKVKLLSSRGGIVAGRFRSYEQGDIIEVSDSEAKRMIDKGRAVAVTPAPKPKAKPKAKPKQATQESDD